MPKAHEERLGILQLFKQLFGDGARVVEAELSLARSEAALAIRGYLIGLAIAMLALAMTIVALIILAQAAAFAVMQYVGNPATAYLIVGLALMLLAAGLALISYHRLSHRHRPVGAVFKQLFGVSK